MSDSARQPDVEIFVIVAPPSTSPEENPRVQRNSTRRAFLIFRSLSALMVCGLPSSGWLLVSGGAGTLGHEYAAQAPGAA